LDLRQWFVVTGSWSLPESSIVRGKLSINQSREDFLTTFRVWIARNFPEARREGLNLLVG